MLRNLFLFGVLLPIFTVSALKCEVVGDDFCGLSDVPTENLAKAKENYKLGEIPFIDTGKEDWFTPSVRFLKQKGWVSGYKDRFEKPTGVFNPTGLVTKAEATKMVFTMSGIIEDTALTTKNPLAQSHWARHWIALAEKLRISLWDGTIDPNQKATRAEVLRLIFGVLKKEPDVELVSDFTDVPTTYRYFRYIQAAKNLGIISGYPDGLFRPDRNISRAEVSKVIEQAYKKMLKDDNTLKNSNIKNITAKEYEKYAVEYTSKPFEFQMKVPGFYHFQSFEAKENELMRFGFSLSEKVEASNILFWLKIIGTEEVMDISIKRKFGGQIISDFPRKGFSRSFFRIEGNVKYENVMEFLQKSIQYKNIESEKPKKEYPIVPEVIQKSLYK